MRTLYYVAAIGGCLVLTGCCTEPAAVDVLEQAGHLTVDQAAAIRAKVGPNTWGWLADAGVALGGAVLAWIGIRLPPGIIPGISRGKSTQVLLKSNKLTAPQ